MSEETTQLESKLPSKRRMIDPPGGWGYGFPKALPDYVKTPKDVYDWLLEEGYPRHQIEWAMQYTRYWDEQDDLIAGI